MMDGGVPAGPVPGMQTLRVLDQDGSAVVYLAADAMQRQVVLTVGHTMLVDPGQQAEFAGWAARLAAVAASHPQLADVAAHGLTGDARPYLAVRSGADTLATRLRVDGALPADQARLVGSVLGRALATLHANGLVHGVVRPATVLFDAATGPVLAGFDAAAPHLGAPFLPSAFTPPELLTAPGQLSPAADVYDLAATLYTVVGGRVPWASDDGSGVADPALRGLPLAEVPGVPPELTAVLRAGLALDPRQRPTAAALAAGLEAVSVMPVAAAAGPSQVARSLPVAAALLTGVGARPVIDVLASLGGSGAVATAAQVGVGAAAAGYQTATAAAPIAGAVSATGTGAFGAAGTGSFGATGTGSLGATGTGSLGAGGGGSAAAGLGVAKVVVIAVLAAVVGAGAVVAYNVIDEDPPQQRAGAMSNGTSSAEPSSAPPTSASPSPSPSGPDNTVHGAARTLEEYMHAMGNGDAAGVCKIAAYEYMKDHGGTYEANVTRCRNEFSILYGAVLTDADKASLRTVRVDSTKIRTTGPNRVVVPRSAITFSRTSKFLEEGWPVTMVWNGKHWYPIET